MEDRQHRITRGFRNSRAILLIQLQTFSMTGQPCDVTFHKKKPALDVKIDKAISRALMKGGNGRKLQNLMERIKLSNGDVISIRDIWTINSMPEGGISKQALETVDTTDGELPVGPEGETLREMIRSTYRCERQEEEDYYLRRYLAS